MPIGTTVTFRRLGRGAVRLVLTFDDITNGQRLAGVVADGEVTVVALERNGETSATLAYRTADGKLDERNGASGNGASASGWSLSYTRWRSRFVSELPTSMSKSTGDG